MTLIKMLVEPVGWTLVHFVWQGLLIGLIHELAIYAAARRSPQLRYGISLFALLGLLVCPFATFAGLWLRTAGAEPSIAALGDPLPVSGSTGDAPALLRGAEAWLPYVVAMWLAGVAGLSIRFCIGLYGLRQLARHADFDAVSDLMRDELARLAQRMGIKRRIRMAISTRISSPLVVGWLKPVIFLPLSAATGLDHQQIRLVLAHELAHLSRHDHLVNLLQVIVETLLFYHPAVHRVSRSLRQEREQCCDDMAACIGDSVIAYARVLAQLEEMRQKERNMALALGIADQELYFRIQRLVGAAPAGSTPDRWLPLMLIALAGMAAVGRAPVLDMPGLSILQDDDGWPQRVSLELPPAVSRPFRPITDDDTDPRMTIKPATEPVSRNDGATAHSQPPAEMREQPGNLEPIVSNPAGSKPVERQPATATAVPPQTEEPSAGHAEKKETANESVVSAGGELLHAEEPAYPRRALRTGQEGQVLLEFTITPDGSVADVEVLEAFPRGLFESAAREAIRQWRYQPFSENGVAISRRVTQVMEFRLSDSSERRSGTTDEECHEQTGTRLCRAARPADTKLRVISP